MSRDKDAFIDSPVKLKIQPKECVLCGGKYIPTNNRQKYCPACRELKKEEHDKIDRHKRLAKAREPGEVVSYTVPVPKRENPEEKMKKGIETPERPALPEGWMEEQQKMDPADPGERMYTAEEIVDAVKKILCRRSRGKAGAGEDARVSIRLAVGYPGADMHGILQVPAKRELRELSDE